MRYTIARDGRVVSYKIVQALVPVVGYTKLTLAESLWKVIGKITPPRVHPILTQVRRGIVCTRLYIIIPASL